MKIITTLHALDIIDLCNEFDDPFGLEKDGGKDLKEFAALWLAQEHNANRGQGRPALDENPAHAEVHLGCMEGDLVRKTLESLPVKTRKFGRKSADSQTTGEVYGICTKIGRFRIGPITGAQMERLLDELWEVVIVNLDTAS